MARQVTSELERRKTRWTSTGCQSRTVDHLLTKENARMARAIRHILVTCAAALLLAPLATIRAANSNPDSPNIIIFLVDDMGVMDTSVPFLTDESSIPKKYLL